MSETSEFRRKRIPLAHGTGDLPVLGFGTPIPSSTTPV